ncbi:MAG: FtsH protease activity modulator HflK [Porticoccaceae bacterium]|nr:FtsH protease activity modulator HflK [Porticoccaceae bacterium]|tara:strand:+ start:52898 stop:54031 length:1134 start_codon:yes stop_codon:yes gene_type:complete
MAWNDQGGGGKDPWGGNRGGDAPPDIDEALRKLKEKFSNFGGGGSGGGSFETGWKSLAVAAGSIILLLWAMLGAYQIDEKEQAIVLRLGKYNDTVGPGLHWNPPLIDSVEIERVTEERQYSARGLMLTEDENIAELTLTVQYNIADVKAFVLNIKDPETTLQQATDSALRHVVGSSGLDDVISTGREQIAVATAEKLQDYLNVYDSGINVVKINIEEARPPTQVQEAYDDVIEAREDLERYINDAQAYSNGIIPQARGEAQRLREEAEGYKSQVVSKAEGETERFVALLTEYKKAPVVTRERLYIDAMEEVMTRTSKVLIDSKGGNNMLYLPLDQLMKSGSISRGSSNMDEADVDRVAEQVLDRIQRNSTRQGEGRR